MTDVNVGGIIKTIDLRNGKVRTVAWTLDEAVQYYKKQGAPADQNALVMLFKEIQREQGGGIPGYLLPDIAAGLDVKESYLQAVIKRIPSLRLQDTHLLQLCGGPNCSKRARLAEFVEKNYGPAPKGFEVQYVGCMRMCGKGPNLKWDGQIYHQADEALIRRLAESVDK